MMMTRMAKVLRQESRESGNCSRSGQRRGRCRCRCNSCITVSIGLAEWSTVAGRVTTVVALVSLNVRCESCCCTVSTVAERTLKRFLMIVCLHVDLQMIRARECRFTVVTLVPFVARVKFNVTIARSLVLKETLTVITTERHLIRVDLIERGRGIGRSRVHRDDVMQRGDVKWTS